MAVEANGDQMIMISADMSGIPDYVTTLVRRKVGLEYPDFDPMKLMIAATHTHTSHTLAAPDEFLIYGRNPITTTRDILAKFMPHEKEYRALVTADDSVIPLCSSI